MSLAVRELSFSFGDVQVLKKVTFKVAPGEFIGIMGPNGSGKTTLLRCITKFLPSENDMILVESKPLNGFTPADMAKTFAVVPQSSATDFPFTVHDIVMMGRIPHIGSRLSGETRRDVDIVRQSMKRTNTLQFAKRIFSELSGGERQRVIIARAIAQKPKVLLLDEPTVYLDISGQIEIMDLLKTLNREEGITTIAVLHDVNLAARYCDRIALLSQGRLEAIGGPKEVLTAETIQSVYGVDVSVRRDPLTQAVYIMPHSPTITIHKHGTRVHLLCGGGTGGVIMKSLHDGGYSLSAGVLNVLDSDYENAKDMHIPVVAEVPFAPISPENHAENLALIDESIAVVVSPFPVGPGNIRNLEAATHALRSGKKVFLMHHEGALSVDFVDGRADALIKGLISSGATVVADMEELLSKLAKRGG
ncbi:MAG: heme ABC transporter ATP-binding protein [Candidatus Thermoplasmatota archaeon]|nr:heme ABC transporter ATP-binding protein [Candidatus Thermoplasmatota archaeon]